MLLDQWIDRLIEYFEYKKNDIGFLGKSKNKLNNKLDIATMQSLKNNPQIIKNPIKIARKLPQLIMNSAQKMLDTNHGN